ncbi:hypothetical protein [Microvirga lotononidis]|uniref:Uncharacterized protein n=1 Tax=Microvirga lotononidis TaxID=864069 RepID=I4YPT7_9HYPH|nr:hypothetical protein [Microvirga lotononidis]EIM25979.1 hypothetical protein MicloDRAFT_00067090 [Microvirga lotononidis]WQO25890.1 hypothetical protein U0023_14360 [Microvirga lotononidis]
MTYADKATALLTHSASGDVEVSLVLDAFSLAERGHLFRQGIRTVTDTDAGSSAHDRDDRIIYNKKTGAVYYDADGIGGSKQIQIATLSNKVTLTHKDFFVI